MFEAVYDIGVNVTEGKEKVEEIRTRRRRDSMTQVDKDDKSLSTEGLKIYPSEPRGCMELPCIPEGMEKYYFPLSHFLNKK